jgi:hypothetical protein
MLQAATVALSGALAATLSIKGAATMADPRIIIRVRDKAGG